MWHIEFAIKNGFRGCHKFCAKGIHEYHQERCNRIFREEFYANPRLLADSIKDMRFHLKHALGIYNTCRPHFSLKGLTPMHYIHNLILDTAA